ncbi:MAG: hypothetical protein CMH98_08540 [Oceanospirillaceae bacterium]|nr:hypothetical protein [Oceanospirillaceae bacterium]|tara:strand:+ start:78201 stop:78785 length:585 start_codon:yes stop_codon:yes gene_type:complete
MSLIMFDMGRRVETPVRPDEFRVRAMSASEKTSHIDKDKTARGMPQDIEAYYQRPEHPPDGISSCADIMTQRLTTLSPDDSIHTAWNTLSSSGFHHLPVVDSELNVVAILSDRDLLQALVHNRDIWDDSIMEVAAHPVVCVLKTTDIRQASNILYEYDIGALPVLNNEHEICGIITRSDILKLLSHYGPMELWA